MKKFLAIIFISIFCFSCAAASQNEENSEWKKVAPYNYLYLDAVTGTEDMYGFNFLLKSYNKGQYEPVNGKKISYTLGQYTIDCAKRKYKIGVIDSYSENGGFVNGDYNRYASFQPIVSGTAVSEVAKELCRM